MGKIIKDIIINNERYHLLDYIESTGTQYINTGLNPIVNRKIEIDCVMVRAGDEAPVLFGTVNSSTGRFDVYAYQNKLWYRTNNSSLSSSLDYSAGQRAKVGMYSTGSVKHYFKDGVEYTQNETLNSGFGNIYIMRRGQAGDNFSYMKLYGFKVWDNINELKLDLIPVERISDGVVGMLNLIDGTLYTNAGTGTFTKGNYISVARAVKTYVTALGEVVDEVEYIESDGSQYINTGIKGNEIYEFELDVLPKVVKSGSASIYKTYLSSGPTLDNFTIGVFRNAEGLFYRNRGTAIYQNEGSVVSQFARHKITSLGNTFKVDNTTLATNVQKPLGSLGEYINLLGNYIGATGEGVAGQLFSCKFYGNNDTLLRDFIPVKVRNTDEYCMLDLVENKLYHNVGTGSFTGNPNDLNKLIRRDNLKELTL